MMDQCLLAKEHSESIEHLLSSTPRKMFNAQCSPDIYRDQCTMKKPFNKPTYYSEHTYI